MARARAGGFERDMKMELVSVRPLSGDPRCLMEATATDRKRMFWP